MKRVVSKEEHDRRSQAAKAAHADKLEWRQFQNVKYVDMEMELAQTDAQNDILNGYLDPAGRYDFLFSRLRRALSEVERTTDRKVYNKILREQVKKLREQAPVIPSGLDNGLDSE